MPANDTMAPATLEDGRYHHRLRQSTLESVDKCAELGRRTIFKLIDRGESDATATGTSLHHGIEQKLLHVIEGWDFSQAEATECALGAWRTLDASGEIRWVQRPDTPKSRQSIELYLRQCVALFFQDVLPTLHPELVEPEFGPIVLHEDDERVIEATGTADYFDSVFGLGDWKTASQKYLQWEKQRWAIQPTVYNWAFGELGYVSATEPNPFTFWIFLKTSKVELQKITVWRGPNDTAWLKHKALQVAKLCEAEINGQPLDSWPLNDNHVLCSPKWCDAWSQCKGQFYEGDWPDTWKHEVPVNWKNP
jgi:hypothetical protein